LSHDKELLPVKRICVFCGSRAGDNPAYAELTRQFGEALVARGLGLVFGGGHIGLMGILADAVLGAGGEAIGVIPEALVAKELAHPALTQLHVVATMHQRKAIMADLADGFVALPGGFGTGDELFEILTWAQLGLHHKPIGLLNLGAFFDPLLTWLDRAVLEGFLKLKHRQLLMVATEANSLLDSLANYRPAEIAPKWIDDANR
jgi:uncharacterized protein (TIGR00730 family)